jgi:tetratricopeptide (TPR) repeat protein
VIFRELGDQEGITWSLCDLGSTLVRQEQYEAARTFLRESLALSRELGNQRGIAHSLGALGNVAREQGEYKAARTLLEESLALSRELGSLVDIAWSLCNLGSAAMKVGKYEAARAHLEESLTIGRELGSHRDIVFSLGALGHLAREAGDYPGCAAYYRESLRLRQSRDDRWAIAQALEDFAGLAERQRQWERAVRLLGAAQGVAQILGQSLPVAVARPEEYQRTVDGARAALGEAAFAAAWAAGQEMTLEEAIRYALDG